jgi:hypothetical protein
MIVKNDREKLVELLAKYFNIGDSYAYNLKRVKSAFACGTMGIDDFEEFDEETVDDIADHLIANGVTIQRWIPVTDRKPERGDRVQAYRTHLGKPLVFTAEYFGEWQDVATGSWWYDITHWQPIQPPKGE